MRAPGCRRAGPAWRRRAARTPSGRGEAAHVARGQDAAARSPAGPPRAAAPRRARPTRTSPVSPTSPQHDARPRAAGARARSTPTAATTARSAAGSSTRSPPATFRKTSWSWSCMPHALLEHREQQRDAAGVEPDGRAPRHARAPSATPAPGSRPGPAGCPRASPARPSPGAPTGRSARNAADGFGDLGEPALAHLEDAHLVGRAEAVLDGAQHAQRVRAVALEVEHRVDQVLEHARAGERALLGDVADEEARDAARLGVRRRAARRDSRTCPTLPGAEASVAVCSVWIESTTTAAGRGASICSTTASADGLGQDQHARAPPRPRRSARSRTCSRRLLAGDVEDRRAPGRASAPHACRASVDLPMPGSPPSSTTEPCTRPPPSTRSSSREPGGAPDRVAARGTAASERARRRRPTTRARGRAPRVVGQRLLDQRVPRRAARDTARASAARCARTAGRRRPSRRALSTMEHC